MASSTTAINQVDNLLYFKNMLETLVLFLKCFISILNGTEKPQTLMTISNNLQQTLLQLLTKFKTIDLGISECDSAMNNIMQFMPQIETMPSNQEIQNYPNLSTLQAALKSSTAKILQNISNMEKQLQSTIGDLLIGEFSKNLGMGLVELIQISKVVRTKINNLQTVQNLLVNTREVTVSIGNYLQYSKNFVINPADFNAKTTRENGFKTAMNLMGKLVPIHNDFCALK